MWVFAAKMQGRVRIVGFEARMSNFNENETGNGEMGHGASRGQCNAGTMRGESDSRPLPIP